MCVQTTEAMLAMLVGIALLVRAVKGPACGRRGVGVCVCVCVCVYLCVFVCPHIESG